jgi:hypothetical protein
MYGIEEGMEKKKGMENLLTKTVAENFPNLQKKMDIQVYNAFRTPNRHDQKRTTPCHTIIIMPKLKKKMKHIESCKRKMPAFIQR